MKAGWVAGSLLLAAALAAGQADVATATLRGTVTDASQAVIPDAQITARNLHTGLTRAASSGPEGRYQIPLLPPGAYEVRVEHAGFSRQVFSRVELTVGQVAVLDAELKPGPVNQEVVVTTEASLVEPERTHQANTIGAREIAHLPNIGRAFTAYVFTLPGVSSSEAPRVQNPGFTFGSSGFSIGGSNGRNNLVMMDGGENEYGSGQLRVVNQSVESIQEFQVNRNAFNAEFGFTAGTAINVVTKSGTNDWHASVYTFYRSQNTSARNFFDRRRAKAFDQQVYPGVTLGGPAVRNKAFFFTSYEAFKSDAARFRDYLEDPALLGPTAAQASYLAKLEATGDSSLRRISANLRGALSAAGYANTMRLLRENSGTFTAPARWHNWTTRGDYHLTDRHHFTGRFSLTHNDTGQLGVARTEAPNASANLYYRDYTMVGAYTWVVSPHLSHLLRAQFAPNNSARTTPAAPGSTSLLLSGLGNFGRPFATPFNTFQNRYQIDDTVAWARGRHHFKFGGSYRPVSYRVINELWFGGEWTFSSGIYAMMLAVPGADRFALASFNYDRANGVCPAVTPLPPLMSDTCAQNGPAALNLSALQSFSVGLPYLFRQGFNNPEWADTAHYVGLFAQDSWKIHARFTLEAGLRFDYDREPRPLTSHAYAAPRLGLAWDVLGDKKTVVRGGLGLFYSPIYYQVAYVTNLLNDSGRYINQIFKTPLDGIQGPAALWAAGVARNKLPFGAMEEADFRALGVNIGRGAPGRVLFDADPAYRNNYSVQGSVSVSRELARNLSLELGYLATRGVHLQLPHEVNYRETGVVTPFLGPQLARIDPTITQLNRYKSVGNSIYHGLTVSLKQRYARGVQFQANYTFSKAIDDQTDFNSAFAAFLPTNLRLERAISTFDIRHNFVASGVFVSPFQAGPGHHPLARVFADVTLSPIIALRSGIPFTLRIGSDINGDTHGIYDRPFYAARNTGIGENFYAVSLRLTKAFYIRRERGWRAEFITELTNLLNHTNFLAVNDVVGTNPRFLEGPYNLRGDRSLSALAPLGFTAAGDPRRFQFGLKVAF